MTYKLSASSLKLMLDCPVCFWWQLKHKIRRPPGPMSQLPNRVEDQILEYFSYYRDNGVLPSELSGLKGTNVQKGMTLLKDVNRNMKCMNGNITVIAKPDDILQSGNKFIVLDYKTAGKRAENCTEEKLIEDIEKYNYQLQMSLYSYVLRNNNMNTEDFAYLSFWFIDRMDSDGKFIFGTKLIRVDIDIDNIKELINKARDILKSDKPPEGSCDFCLSSKERFGRNDEGQSHQNI